MELFVSYNHNDSPFIDEFVKYIQPLVGLDKLITSLWYDRNIRAGSDLWDEIDGHIYSADVVCLFISSDYLASGSCLKELETALYRRENEGVLVIPIILRECGWLDHDEKLKSILALPNDGKPLNSFTDRDGAWKQVYNGIKKVLEEYERVHEIEISDNFKRFLNDATAFSKSHPHKDTIYLDDIFVYPYLAKVEQDGETTRVDSLKLIDNFQSSHRFVISGRDQSGKTTLLKQFIKVLLDKGFVPIYVRDPSEALYGNFENRINSAFKDQYTCKCNLNELDENKVIILLDDFHKTKHKDKILSKLLNYRSFILVIDDIYALDTRKSILAEIDQYEIKPLMPSRRMLLINKWLEASEGPEEQILSNDYLKQLDETRALIEDSLGKVLGKGIMPAFPYFILTLLVINADVDKPLDEKITSQGHCYQALIVVFLKKKGVSNVNMDSYINFLTELAYKIYQNKGRELSTPQFEEFLEEYKRSYNFTGPLKSMLDKLEESNIIDKTSLGFYKFSYPYIYYFFAGRFFAQAWEDQDDPNHDLTVNEIDKILFNLHNTTNAYIAIFISHHTKNMALLRKIKEIADNIYCKFQPCTFDRNALSIFSGVENVIETPTLPVRETPLENRELELEDKDRLEQNIDIEELDVEEDDENPDDEFAKELRRSVKTVEVIGSILKNRAGSIRNEQLEGLFESAFNIQLRLTSNFVELVQLIWSSKEGVKFLEERIKETHPELPENQLPIRAKQLFWGINYGFLVNIMKKTTFSLGSAALARVADNVCERIDSPAAFILKHSILMWFKKNIEIYDLQKMDRIIDNPIAKNVLLCLISDYCKVHVINYKDRSRLMQLGLKKQLFLPSPHKEM